MSEQLYRCGLKTPMGAVTSVDVMASTGDDAATAALRDFPGAFVTHIEPAPAGKQPHLEGKETDGNPSASVAKALADARPKLGVKVDA